MWGSEAAQAVHLHPDGMFQTKQRSSHQLSDLVLKVCVCVLQVLHTLEGVGVLVFPKLRPALFPAGGAVAGRLGLHPLPRQPGRTGAVMRGGLEGVAIGNTPTEQIFQVFCEQPRARCSPSLVFLFPSQDPAWSRPTFSFLHTFFAGPSSSTESSITRVSVAKPWGTLVSKVSTQSRTQFQSARMSQHVKFLSA